MPRPVHNRLSARLALLVVATLVVAGVPGTVPAQPATVGADRVLHGQLQDAERDLLRDLFEWGLFEPGGCEWVSGPAGDGWRFARGREAGVPFSPDPPLIYVAVRTNGAQHPQRREATDDFVPSRFVDHLDARTDWLLEIADRAPESAAVEATQLAAWAWRLGRPTRAAVLVGIARDIVRRVQAGPLSSMPGADLAAIARGMGDMLGRDAVEVAREAFSRFSAGDDMEAIWYGNLALSLRPRLSRLMLSASVQADFDRAFVNVPDMIEDAQRRVVDGNDWPDHRPDTWDAMETPARIAWLIGALEDVDDIRGSDYTKAPFADDWRCEALVGIGEAAIEPLIAAVESDARLIRAPYFRAGEPCPEPLTLRVVALGTLQTILRLEIPRHRFWAPDIAAWLRDYWRRFGHLDMPERMMAVMTDPSVAGVITRDAARNLLTLNREVTIFANRRYPDVTPDRAFDRLQHFVDPTVAEAMMAAMRRELRTFAAQPTDVDGRPIRSGDDEATVPDSRRDIVNEWADLLTDLGDRRIAADMANSSRTGTLHARVALASAALRLGNSDGVEALAESIADGTVPAPVVVDPAANPDPEAARLPSAAEQAARVFDRLLQLLNSAPETGQRVLSAIANPDHPLHTAWRDSLRAWMRERMGGANGSRPAGLTIDHPAAVAMLRLELTNIEPTGIRYSLTGGMITVSGPDQQRRRVGGRAPAELAGRVNDPSEQESRWCDEAGRALWELVAGVPFNHPLLPERDAGLTHVIGWLERYGPALRRATWEEANTLQMGRSCYLPESAPRQRQATSDDLAAGRAIFVLPPGGRAADDIPVPGGATILAADGPAAAGTPVLVLQAERDARGNLLYGIVGRGVCARVEAATVSPVRRIR